MASTPDPTEELTTEPAAAEAELPLDVVFDLLSNERRRRTLQYLLHDSGGVVTLGDLAEFIASEENDKSIQALSSSERKRVYISLYQCHLPKLNDANVVDFDADRKTVELAGNVGEVTRFMPQTQVQMTTREENGSLDLISAVVRWFS